MSGALIHKFIHYFNHNENTEKSQNQKEIEADIGAMLYGSYFNLDVSDVYKSIALWKNESVRLDEAFDVALSSFEELLYGSMNKKGLIDLIEGGVSMLSTKRVIKILEKLILEMEKINVRKVISISLSETNRNIPKVPKAIIKEMLEEVKQKNKTNLSIVDIPDDDSRYIFQDILNGKLVVNNLSKEIIIGVRI